MSLQRGRRARFIGQGERDPLMGGKSANGNWAGAIAIIALIIGSAAVIVGSIGLTRANDPKAVYDLYVTPDDAVARRGAPQHFAKMSKSLGPHTIYQRTAHIVDNEKPGFVMSMLNSLPAANKTELMAAQARNARRNTRGGAQKREPHVFEPVFLTTPPKSITYQSISDAMDFAISQDNVLSARILLAPGTYTDTINVRGVTSSSSVGSGELNTFRGLEIVGDSRPVVGHHFVHGGFTPFSPLSPSAFGASDEYGDRRLPTKLTMTTNTVKVEVLNKDTSLAAVQPNLTMLGLVAGDTMTISFPNPAGSQVAGTNVDVAIVSMTSDTVTFAPALTSVPSESAVFGSTLPVGTSIVFQPNVIVKAPAGATVRSVFTANSDVTIRGVRLMMPDSADLPVGAVLPDNAVEIAGAAVRMNGCVVDVRHRTTSSGAVTVRGGGYLGTTLAIFSATEPDVYRSGSITVIGGCEYPGGPCLGGITVRGAGSHLEALNVALIDSTIDPVNVLRSGFFHSFLVNVVGSKSTCAFTAREGYVLTETIACLRAEEAFLLPELGGTFVVESNRMRAVLYDTGAGHIGFGVALCYFCGNSGSITRIGRDELFQSGITGWAYTESIDELSTHPDSPGIGAPLYGIWFTDTSTFDSAQELVMGPTLAGDSVPDQTVAYIDGRRLRTPYSTGSSGALPPAWTDMYLTGSAIQDMTLELDAAPFGRYIANKYAVYASTAHQHTVDAGVGNVFLPANERYAVFTGGIGSVLRFTASADGTQIYADGDGVTFQAGPGTAAPTAAP
jgi:hypothetical protein